MVIETTKLYQLVEANRSEGAKGIVLLKLGDTMFTTVLLDFVPELDTGVSGGRSGGRSSSGCAGGGGRGFGRASQDHSKENTLRVMMGIKAGVGEGFIEKFVLGLGDNRLVDRLD